MTEASRVHEEGGDVVVRAARDPRPEVAGGRRDARTRRPRVLEVAPRVQRASSRSGQPVPSRTIEMTVASSDAVTVTAPWCSSPAMPSVVLSVPPPLAVFVLSIS